MCGRKKNESFGPIFIFKVIYKDAPSDFDKMLGLRTIDCMEEAAH